MTKASEVWGELGELAEEDAVPVLSRLFAIYEEQQQRNPEDKEAALFFRNLATVITQTSACNLNRR